MQDMTPVLGSRQPQQPFELSHCVTQVLVVLSMQRGMATVELWVTLGQTLTQVISVLSIQYWVPETSGQVEQQALSPDQEQGCAVGHFIVHFLFTLSQYRGNVLPPSMIEASHTVTQIPRWSEAKLMPHCGAPLTKGHVNTQVLVILSPQYCPVARQLGQGLTQQQVELPVGQAKYPFSYLQRQGPQVPVQIFLLLSLQERHQVDFQLLQVAQSGCEHKYWTRTYSAIPQDELDVVPKFTVTLEALLASVMQSQKLVAVEPLQQTQGQLEPVIQPPVPVGLAVAIPREVLPDLTQMGTPEFDELNHHTATLILNLKCGLKVWVFDITLVLSPCRTVMVPQPLQALLSPPVQPVSFWKPYP